MLNLRNFKSIHELYVYPCHWLCFLPPLGELNTNLRKSRPFISASILCLVIKVYKSMRSTNAEEQPKIRWLYANIALKKKLQSILKASEGIFIFENMENLNFCSNISTPNFLKHVSEYKNNEIGKSQTVNGTKLKTTLLCKL